MKKISVIVPCYNVERWIDRCITSIIAQTFGIGDLEVICIDDASTDGTWLHLQRWEQLYPDDILLIRQQANRRQGTARNIGLQYASADWIAFVDADDWLEPDYFEQLSRPLTKFACDVVACEWGRDTSQILTYFDEVHRKGSGEERYIIADTTEITKLMLVSGVVMDAVVWGKLIRKSWIMENQIFFPEDLTYEDRFWCPLSDIYAEKIYRVGEKLYHYFLNPGSTVLSINADHHVDWITIQMLKWKEYHRRGIWDMYQEEMEFIFLADAVGFLKLLALRYEKPPYPFFQLEKNLIRRYVAGYKDEGYIPIITEIEEQRILLDMLYSDLDQKGFQDMIELVKDMYRNKQR